MTNLPRPQAEHAAARAEPLAEAGLLEVVGKQALELLSDPRQFLSVFFASAPPALLGSARDRDAAQPPSRGEIGRDEPRSAET